MFCYNNIKQISTSKRELHFHNMWNLIFIQWDLL